MKQVSGECPAHREQVHVPARLLAMLLLIGALIAPCVALGQSAASWIPAGNGQCPSTCSARGMQAAPLGAVAGASKSFVCKTSATTAESGQRAGFAVPRAGDGAIACHVFSGGYMGGQAFTTFDCLCLPKPAPPPAVAPPTVVAAPPPSRPEFIVANVRLDRVKDPKNAFDLIEDCKKNPLCVGAIDLAASTLGVPPGTITAGAAAIPNLRSEGEEFWFTYHLPQGYSYCRSRIVTTSVVPNTGDRASVLSAMSEERGINGYTWTPRLQSWEGRSWLEADFILYGVADEVRAQHVAAGRCRVHGQRLIDCRGGEGVNKGMPACGVSED